MELLISSGDLQKKLPFINHAVSTRSQMPILLNLSLEAKDKKLIINATDLEFGIQTSVPAQIEEDGGITIPAKIFTELISSLPQEEIRLKTRQSTLEVVSKNTRSLFQGIDRSEFPRLFEEKGEKIVAIKSDEINKEFGKVIFASSQDMGRPALSGTLIKPEEEGFLVVATDGYRLSMVRVKTDQKGKEITQLNKSITIPSRIIRELILLKQQGVDVNIYVSQTSNQILFISQETILVGRLIEVEFPAYEKIIPTEHGTQVEFDKKELYQAVKTCSIFARETANIVRFSFEKNQIIVSANTPSVGENRVEVGAKIIGEENEIAFNAKYVLDLFSNIDEEEMIFEMTGPLNPGVFKIKDDQTFLHIIMPIRVQG